MTPVRQGLSTSLLTLVAVVAAGTLALTGCGSGDDAAGTTATTTVTTAASAEPPEDTTTQETATQETATQESAPEPTYSEAAKNLAIIDGAEGDEGTYERALRRLKRLCRGATLTNLSDYAANSQKIIKDETGDEVATLKIVRGVTTAATGDPGNQTCKDLFTAYLTLVTSGSAP